MFKLFGFFGILFLAVAAFIYVMGALIMAVTGNSLREIFLWPYHFVRKRPYLSDTP